MTKDEFKSKYFTDNFYWINKENYIQLQLIGIEMGCLCPTRKPNVISWHEGFNCSGFRTYERNNNVTIFQKEPFLVHGKKTTDYDQMLKDYNSLKNKSE